MLHQFDTNSSLHIKDAALHFQNLQPHEVTVRTFKVLETICPDLKQQHFKRLSEQQTIKHVVRSLFDDLKYNIAFSKYKVPTVRVLDAILLPWVFNPKLRHFYANTQIWILLATFTAYLSLLELFHYNKHRKTLRTILRTTVLGVLELDL